MQVFSCVWGDGLFSFVQPSPTTISKEQKEIDLLRITQYKRFFERERMSKLVYSAEQKELVSLLTTIKGLPQLNETAQLVLANIIYWYGTKKAQRTGYVYRSNTDMVNDTGISLSSLHRGVRMLVVSGIVKTERGNQTVGDKQASKYWLKEDILRQIHFCEQTDTPIDTLVDTPIDTELLGRAFHEVRELRQEVKELRTFLVSNPNTLTKATTIDTPIDTQDIDIEKEKERIIDRREMTQQTTDTNTLIAIDSDDKSDIQFEDTHTGGSVQKVDTATNDKFSIKKERIEGLLDRCYKCEKEQGVTSKIEAIRRDIEYLYKLPLSDKQRKWVEDWAKRVDGLEKAKREYFKRGERMEQERQTKLDTEKAVKAGRNVNIRQQPNTAAPVNDRDKMDADNEFTDKLLFPEQEQGQDEISFEELVRINKAKGDIMY